jgi:hypothetical protein
VAYNIEIWGKIKLLMEYENTAQKVLLITEQMLQNAKRLQHARLSWHVRYQFPSRCSPAFVVRLFRSQQIALSNVG